MDEYENFGNRRLRTVGELIQEASVIGLYRMERVVRERMTTEDVGSHHAAVHHQYPSRDRGSQGVLRQLLSSRSSWTKPNPWPASRTAPALAWVPGAHAGARSHRGA